MTTTGLRATSAASHPDAPATPARALTTSTAARDSARAASSTEASKAPRGVEPTRSSRRRRTAVVGGCPLAPSAFATRAGTSE
ncbi:MAG: hypothetical protein PGN11_09805 [Quadrisphaera sp.]